VAAQAAGGQRPHTRGTGHHAALRQLGNRLVGLLHDYLKANQPYKEDTAWAHHTR
jgi:hypothetical protein